MPLPGVRLTSIRHIIYACLALVVTVCAAEVGLRVYSVSCVVSEVPDEPDSLIGQSWTRHHQLIPLTTVSIESPLDDTLIQVSTNSFGLRGAEPAADSAQMPRRILVLGDDLVFGSSVESDQSYCALLEERLNEVGPGFEVINAGTPGYCPLLSYLHYRHELAGLVPALVVLHVNWSDSADDTEYRRHTHVDSQQGPLGCSHPALHEHAAANKARVVCRELRLLRWLSQRAGEFLDDPSPTRPQRPVARQTPHTDWQTSMTRMLEPVERLRDLLAGSQVPLVVVVTPLPSSNSEQPIDRSVALITNHLRESNIDVIAANNQLREHLRAVRSSGRIACVATLDGHDRLAESLAPEILSRLSARHLNDGAPPERPVGLQAHWQTQPVMTSDRSTSSALTLQRDFR